MNDHEIIQDFRRRWEGTYVYLFMEKSNEEILVHVDRIEDNTDKVATLAVTSQRYGQLVLNFGSADHELRFKYPPVGVFQFGDDSYLFRRRPARQFRRGICPDNSFIWNITKGVVGNRVRFAAAEVQAAFDSKKFGLGQALKMLSSGSRGVALENNFSITLSVDDIPEHILWHWTHPIARINKDGEVSAVFEKKYASYIAEGLHT